MKDDDDEEKESNEEVGDEDFDVIVDFFLLIVKFFLHYAFGVYLLTIANEESSVVISIAFIIFALISFSKVIFIQNFQFFQFFFNFDFFSKFLICLQIIENKRKLLIYSSITKDEISRTLVSILIYIAALRLSLFPGKYHSPLYFGSLLSNLSVFALYISFKNIVTLFTSLLLMIGLFIHAFTMNTIVGMLFNLINIAMFCGFFTAKNGKGIIYNFLITIGILLFVAIFNKGSFEAYFKVVDLFMKNIIPMHVTKFLNSLKSFNGLKEMEVAQNVLGFVEKWVFGEMNK